MKPDRTDTGFFREEAVKHHYRETPGAGVLRASPPWSWWVLLTSASLIVAAVVFLTVAEVQVSGRSEGVVRTMKGGGDREAGIDVLRVHAPLADRHSPFVRTGDRVRIEPPDPARGAHTALKGRILVITSARVGPDDSSLPATALFMEIALETPGDDSPHGVRLRDGMPVSVRLTLRRQRLIAYLADPLQRWIE